MMRLKGLGELKTFNDRSETRPRGPWPLALGLAAYASALYATACPHTFILTHAICRGIQIAPEQRLVTKLMVVHRPGEGGGRTAAAAAAINRCTGAQYKQQIHSELRDIPCCR
jgi:hypothetical protein